MGGSVSSFISREDIGQKIETWGSDHINQFRGQAAIALKKIKWVWAREISRMALVIEFVVVGVKPYEDNSEISPDKRFRPGITVVKYIASKKSDNDQVTARTMAEWFKTFMGKDEYIVREEDMFNEDLVPTKDAARIGHVQHISNDYEFYGNIITVSAFEKKAVVKKGPEAGKEKTFTDEKIRPFFNSQTQQVLSMNDQNWKDALANAGFVGMDSTFEILFNMPTENEEEVNDINLD